MAQEQGDKKVKKELLTYEKPRIILEEKIEGRAGTCNPGTGGKAAAPGCGFLNS